MSNENMTPNLPENVRQKAPRKKARGLDLIAYLLCLVVAFGIWAYVTSTETNEYEYQFKGVVVNLEGTAALKENYNLSPISGYGNEITVTVKGRRSDILEYTADDIFAYVDLSSVKTPDRHSLEVHVELPENIQFVSAEPSKINVFVDEIVEKQVPIDVHVIYSCEDNITVYDPVINDEDILQDKITITGPKTVVDTIEYALIEKDLGNVTTGVNFKSTFTLIDTSGDEVTNPYVKSDVNEIAVSVKATLEKIVALKATPEADKEYNYTVVWKYDGEIVENVKIVGDPLVVASYENISIEIPNISTVKNGNAALPDNVSVYVGTNRVSTISYEIVKTPIENKE